MPAKNFPIYLFLGEEDFLKEEAVRGLRLRYLNSRTQDLNYSVFYAKDKNFDLSGLLDTLNTLPFLSKTRLVVLKDADALNVSSKQSIISYLQKPKETSIFVIESQSSVIKGDFLLAASSLANLVYYRRLTDSGIDAWLFKKAKSFGKKLSKEAIYIIKESLPNNLRMLSSNMENIILYVGKRPLITKQDVERVVGLVPTHTAFELINSMRRKDVRKALRIFSSLKRDRKKETELVGLLAWNFRMILRVKELLRIKSNMEIHKDIGLNPRAFDQLVKHASGFKRNEILLLLNELLKADTDIKTGNLPRDVIERLILRMCS